MSTHIASGRTRLKYERTSRGLSQATVGVVAMIHQPVVAQIENGRLTPTPEQLQRLADVFRVPAEDLLKRVVIVCREDGDLR
jgi:transcriptional regulator with XRE-family HTH domain